MSGLRLLIIWVKNHWALLLVLNWFFVKTEVFLQYTVMTCLGFFGRGDQVCLTTNSSISFCAKETWKQCFSPVLQLLSVLKQHECAKWSSHFNWKLICFNLIEAVQSNISYATFFFSFCLYCDASSKKGQFSLSEVAKQQTWKQPVLRRSPPIFTSITVVTSFQLEFWSALGQLYAGFE